MAGRALSIPAFGNVGGMHQSAMRVLHPDVLLHVFGRLKGAELALLSMTCRELDSFVTNHHALFEAAAQSEYPLQHAACTGKEGKVEPVHGRMLYISCTTRHVESDRQSVREEQRWLQQEVLSSACRYQNRLDINRLQQGHCTVLRRRRDALVREQLLACQPGPMPGRGEYTEEMRHKLEERLAKVSQELSSLEARLASGGSELAELEESMGEQQGRKKALAGRLQALETRLAALQAAAAQHHKARHSSGGGSGASNGCGSGSGIGASSSSSCCSSSGYSDSDSCTALRSAPSCSSRSPGKAARAGRGGDAGPSAAAASTLSSSPSCSSISSYGLPPAAPSPAAPSPAAPVSTCSSSP